MFSYARHNGLIGKERHRNLLSFQTGSRLGTQGRRQRTEISDLDFLFLSGLQPLFILSVREAIDGYTLAGKMKSTATSGAKGVVWYLQGLLY